MLQKHLIVISLILLSFTSTKAEGIIFSKETKWENLVSLARKEKKLIFLDAYTTWCGPCKYLQSKIFPQKEVGNFFNKNFINVKMDMEAGEGLLLSDQFEVTAYPTLLFINGDGQLVHKSIGAMESDELLELGLAALDPDKQFYTQKKKALAGTLTAEQLDGWLHLAENLKENSADTAIEIFLQRNKESIFQQKILEIMVVHSERLEEKWIRKLYDQRTKVESILAIDSADFSGMMMSKIMNLAEKKSAGKNDPDFSAYYQVLNTYEPANAKFETHKFKMQYWSGKRMTKALIDELVITLKDQTIGLRATDMAYLVLSYTPDIIRSKRELEIIELVQRYKVPIGQEKKKFTKDLALLSIYAEMKDRKQISVYKSKLLAEQDLPEKIQEWALSL